MDLKIVYSLILLSYFLGSFIPITANAQTTDWWDDHWSYRMELSIPVDTSNPQAAFQPVDTHIIFLDPCWGLDETTHSVRVIAQDDGDYTELDCQLYDMNHSNNHITSCNLVFLLPEHMSGEESYYVYYDDEETTTPEYQDYVSIEESYYLYEPLPGYPFEAEYYKILQNQEMQYIITQGGTFMGSGIAQQVTKMKPGATDALPHSGELFASFDFMYYYGNNVDDYSGSVQHLVSKEILIDGNLMIRCGIISESTSGDIETTGTYTYYYNPTDTTRIYAHIIHETHDEFTIDPEPEVEGTIASFQCGGLESSSIEGLNFGRIYPFLHVYTEDNIITEYPLNQDPEHSPSPGAWANTLFIDANDDIDLGNYSWISYDEGEEGIAHGLILGSNSIVNQGTDERDGVQVRGREQDASDLPGLESNMIYVDFSRNTYEPDEPYDVDVPDDLVIEYDAEFFSTTTGGYQQVSKEAQLFQPLVALRPRNQEDITSVEETKGNTLTVFVHHAHSFPQGSTLSLLTGKNFSYISADLYHEDQRLCAGIGGRIPTNPLPDFTDTTFLEKIRLALGIFDWRNISLVKKIRFFNLEPGIYLVKIYREQPLMSKERQFIGYTIVDVDCDTTARVFCHKQGTLQVSVMDQHDKLIPDVHVCFYDDDICITREQTTDDAPTKLAAPWTLLKPYTLTVETQGRILYEQDVRMGYVRTVIPQTLSVFLDHYTLDVTIYDTWGLYPAIDLQPSLRSDLMNQPIVAETSSTTNDRFVFSDVFSGAYTLTTTYKSFDLRRDLDVEDDMEITLEFPAEYHTGVQVANNRGIPIDNAQIQLTRQGKSTTATTTAEGTAEVLLPPGSYEVKVTVDDALVAQRIIQVSNDRTFDLVTIEQPILPTVLYLMALFIVLVSGVIALYRRRVFPFLKVLCIALVVVAVGSSWWMVHGESSDALVQSTSTLYLLPQTLITHTATSEVLTGEAATLPTIFTDVLFLVILGLGLGCILLLISMVGDVWKKQKLILGSLLLAFIVFGGLLGLFYIATNELATAGVGSFIGQGLVDITIPGEGIQHQVQCTWRPDLGFLFCVTAVLLVFTLFIVQGRTISKKNNKTIRDYVNRKTLISALKRYVPFIGIIILIYLIVSIGTEEIIATFMQISPWYLLIAAVLTLPRVLLRNLGWQLILRKQHINVSYWKSLKVFLIGYFYGAITPGYIGQLMRIPYLKEETGEPTGKLFINTIIEEGIHTMSLYLMMVLGSLLIVDQFPEALPIALAVLFGHLLLYGFFIKKERGEKVLRFLIKILIPKRFKTYLSRFVDTFYTDFPSIKDFLLPFIVVIPTWFIIYTQIYIIALSIGVTIPYGVFLLLAAIANIVAFLPITSAGLGTREATMVFLFSLFGETPEKALVVSLAGHLLTDVLTGGYGFILSLTEARATKKDLSELQTIFDEME